MGDAILVASQGLANSLRCFVINAVALVGNREIEKYGIDESTRSFLAEQRTKPRATIVGPGRTIIAGPLEDAGDAIVYADVDTDDLIRGKIRL